MQNQSKDWLLAASITLGVGVAAAIVVPSGKLGSALLSTTTGAVIGAAVLNGKKVKTQQENEVRWKQLEEQLIRQ